MPRFVFKLEPVLNLREREEREHQRAVAVLERERMRLEAFIRECQRASRAERLVLRDALAEGGRVDLWPVRMQAAAAGELTTRAARAAVELAGLTKRIEQARALLIEATKRRRAMELLKERRLEEWRRTEAKAEFLLVDEIGMRVAHTRDAEAEVES
ncbi:MAG TPA: flagellar export protein FliJ [Phycisphaerales bacterium]|nr:flagellar export protein FliJ [Phycisphaerales bacterium]